MCSGIQGNTGEFNEEILRGYRLEWRNHARQYECDGIDYSRLYSHINNLADSVSGLLIEPNFNQYLVESCQLLANSLDLIHQGYFDAAFYSVRQAGEVILIGALFSDLDQAERKEQYRKWIDRDYFPSFSKLAKRLENEGRNFGSLLEQMPEVKELIKKVNSNANKYIHKQGYGSFYVRRPGLRKKSAQLIQKEFTDYFEAMAKVCAVFRLAVDPLPILKDDPELLYRFPDCLTFEFSSSFIDGCLGSDFVKKYRETDFYQSWLDAIKSAFPKLNESTYNVSNLRYVDLSRLADILDELDKLHFNEAVAVLFMGLFANKAVAVHLENGFDTFTNSNKWSNGLTLSDMSVYVERLGGINVSLREICRLAEFDLVNGSLPVESSVTSFRMGSEPVCVETDCKLNSDEIVLGHKAGKELADLYCRIRDGDSGMAEIKETEVFKRLVSVTEGQQAGTLFSPD